MTADPRCLSVEVRPRGRVSDTVLAAALPIGALLIGAWLLRVTEQWEQDLLKMVLFIIGLGFFMAGVSGMVGLTVLVLVRVVAGLCSAVRVRMVRRVAKAGVR